MKNRNKKGKILTKKCLEMKGIKKRESGNLTDTLDTHWGLSQPKEIIYVNTQYLLWLINTSMSVKRYQLSFRVLFFVPCIWRTLNFFGSFTPFIPIFVLSVLQYFPFQRSINYYSVWYAWNVRKCIKIV